MRRGPVIHGVLFVIAALWAYQTWTRDDSVKIVKGTVDVWGGDAASVQAVALTLKDKTTRIERRGAGADAHLWITSERRVPAAAPPPKPKPPTPDASGADASQSTVEPAAPEPTPPAEPRLEKDEFPASTDAEELLARIAPLKALRRLDGLDDARKKEYGLADPAGTLVVTMGGKEKKLAIGGRVYGGEDRYAMDLDTGVGYVLEADVVRPLEFPESTLRLRKLHDFEIDKVAGARIKVGESERKLSRAEGKAEGPIPVSEWRDVAKPGEPDQTLANFMDRLWRLTPLQYATPDEVKDAKLLFRVTYSAKGGADLGWLEFYEAAPTGTGPDAQGKHLVKTERTRVFARLPFQVSDQIAQDVGQVLGTP